MANKYVDVSATYNGDGTLSTPAAGAGQPGAWNSLIQVLSGSTSGAYGTINAGDVVYVRTKAGGNNLSQTLASALTFFSAVNAFVASIPTKENPITFIFDTGYMWLGDSGTFKLTCNSTSNVIIAKDFINLLATKTNDTTYGFQVDATYASGTATVWTGAAAAYEGLLFTTPQSSTTGVVAYRYVPTGTAYLAVVYRNCRWNVGAFFSNNHPFFSAIPSYANAFFYGCIADFTGSNTTVDGNTRFLEFTNTDNHIEFHGLRVLGTPSNQYHKLFNITAAVNMRRLYFYDCDLGNLSLSNVSNSEPSGGGIGIRCIVVLFSGINGQPFDYREDTYFGVSQWRAGQNYPTFSAQLPDGNNTPWSVQVYQQWAKPGAREFICTDICKLYTAAAAVRTLRFELLIKRSWNSAPTNSQWWVEITYIDNATGNPVYLTSKSHTGAIPSSDAQWMVNGSPSTVYGGNTYDPRYISITTPTAVKPNTKIRGRIVSNYTPATPTDFYFIDPEFSII